MLTVAKKRRTEIAAGIVKKMSVAIVSIVLVPGFFDVSVRPERMSDSDGNDHRKAESSPRHRPEQRSQVPPQ